MTKYPEGCLYYHTVCKDFFMDQHEECPYEPLFCLMYWDLKEQEEKEYKKELFDDTK